jgi:hypothetical protein
VIEAYEKHWNTQKTKKLIKSFWRNGPTQCLGFRDSIQTNSVQTEVRRFSLEGEKPFRWTAKAFVAAIILIKTPWLIDSGWTYESPRFRNDWMVRNLLCKRKHCYLWWPTTVSS